MPNINLRLTDEEHSTLERWAHDGHRSMQKEIIWRLFSGELSERGDSALSGEAASTETRPAAPRSESVSKKRLYACKHYVPPTKVCRICDVA